MPTAFPPTVERCHPDWGGFFAYILPNQKGQFFAFETREEAEESLALVLPICPESTSTLT